MRLPDPEPFGDLVHRGALAEVDVLGPGEQQGEGQGLRIPVGKGLVRCRREQQVTPVPGEARERLLPLISAAADRDTLRGELIEYRRTQQPAQRRHIGDKPAHRGDLPWRPRQELGREELESLVGNNELLTSGPQIT